MLRNAFLVFILFVITIAPLYIIKPGGEEDVFSGADAKATELITQIRPDYEPWFQPLFEPPSSEIESLFFAIQASIGSAIIGYYFGYLTSRRKRFSPIN